MSATMDVPEAPSRWSQGLAGGLLATVLCLVVYWIGGLVGVFEGFVWVPAGPGMAAVPVVIVCLVAGLGAGAAYRVLEAKSRQPEQAFLRLAVVVLLLSFVAPALVPGNTVPQIVTLNVMHVVAAGAIVWALRR